jgi:DNA-binding NarL/FixJ family response regulator
VPGDAGGGPGGQRRALPGARIFGALQAQREALGLPVIYREDHDRAVAAARTSLGPRAFGTAWAAGRALTLEQAAELALAPPAADRPGGLTERELEVLALVAGGLTNEQVAA